MTYNVFGGTLNLAPPTNRHRLCQGQAIAVKYIMCATYAYVTGSMSVKEMCHFTSTALLLIY